MAKNQMIVFLTAKMKISTKVCIKSKCFSWSKTTFTWHDSLAYSFDCEIFICTNFDISARNLTNIAHWGCSKHELYWHHQICLKKYYYRELKEGCDDHHFLRSQILQNRTNRSIFDELKGKLMEKEGHWRRSRTTIIDLSSCKSANKPSSWGQLMLFKAIEQDTVN